MHKYSSGLKRFNQNILSKYEIYSSLFTSLPFDEINKTGTYLALFSTSCEDGYNENKNPTEIINDFFIRFFKNFSDRERQKLLFKFIQYIERQVVLFDAIEDSAFKVINNLDGLGSISQVKEELESKNRLEDLKIHLKKCGIRTVLTAHPTQFYPDTVIGIIVDLASAVRKNNISRIKQLLFQLAQTPFFNKKKPTPYDEAISLVWYLEHVFYDSISEIVNHIRSSIFQNLEEVPSEVVSLGFWPGGDRDGNPFVTPDITKKVGDLLRSTIIRCYSRDIKRLKKRLTFKQVNGIIKSIESDLYRNMLLTSSKSDLCLGSIKSRLKEIKDIIIKNHQSLYIEEVNDLIGKVNTFGLHFATLDIRQDSRMHHSALISIVEAFKSYDVSIFPDNYEKLSEESQIGILQNINVTLDPLILNDGIAKNTIESIYAMKDIQKYNGELGANRYIISNNQKAINVIEAFTMIRLCNWKEPTVDIVPLFETVDDLENAQKVMKILYINDIYREHLKRRKNKQTIMLGFSDGTKDGGYLMANWAIYKAKESLTQISREYGINVIFFDGRGGPPARGGGKTHQFYASLGESIENNQVQMTVQGQTISSNFGTVDSCKFNLEQLLSSTLSNHLFSDVNQMTNENKDTMQKLADISYEAYKNFKGHPKFISYLEKMSTLKYYGKTNIGSRPSKRGFSDKLVFEDLRAIPLVGGWSQLKQNVPGFFGVGASISEFDKKGDFDKVKSLYENSLFFRTLLENSMMSLTKSFFKLTSYMESDSEFGEFWKIIYDEYQLSKKMLLKVTGFKVLMENMPEGKASIQVREKIVLPLLTIQQYALKELHGMENNSKNKKQIETYEKMVTRSLFGNINASRNSA